MACEQKKAWHSASTPKKIEKEVATVGARQLRTLARRGVGRGTQRQTRTLASGHPQGLYTYHIVLTLHVPT